MEGNIFMGNKFPIGGAKLLWGQDPYGALEQDTKDWRERSRTWFKSCRKVATKPFYRKPEF